MEILKFFLTIALAAFVWFIFSQYLNFNWTGIGVACLIIISGFYYRWFDVNKVG